MFSFFDYLNLKSQAKRLRSLVEARAEVTRALKDTVTRTPPTTLNLNSGAISNDAFKTAFAKVHFTSLMLI